MQITEFAFRLFLIFIPGIIGFLIVDALTVHKPTSPFFATLYSAVLGVLSYLASYPLSLLLRRPYHFLLMISDNKSGIDYVDVAFATALSIPIGLLVATLIYQSPAIYLNGPRSRFQIEFPNVPYLPSSGEEDHEDSFDKVEGE